MINCVQVSPLEAVGRFPGSRSCVHSSAEGREQWEAVPLLALLLPEKHVQCTCAATHRLFYTIPHPAVCCAPYANQSEDGTTLPCWGRTSSGCFLMQFVPADSVAGLMVRWRCLRNGAVQEQPCLLPFPLELQDCPDYFMTALCILFCLI